MNEPWLDEGLATFAELEFIENVYPDESNWWWEYRVNFYDPKGSIDLPIHHYSDYHHYRDSVYLRTAQFLAELRNKVGYHAFSQAVRSYVQTNEHNIVSADDFWRAFQPLPGYPFSEITAKYFSSK